MGPPSLTLARSLHRISDLSILPPLLCDLAKIMLSWNLYSLVENDTHIVIIKPRCCHSPFCDPLFIAAVFFVSNFLESLPPSPRLRILWAIESANKCLSLLFYYWLFLFLIEAQELRKTLLVLIKILWGSFRQIKFELGFLALLFALPLLEFLSWFMDRI